MKYFFFILIMLSLQNSIKGSELSNMDIEAIDIKKVREEALNLYKKGKIKLAAEKLENNCGGQDSVDSQKLLQEKRWCYSDYMLYLYKSDQSEKCINELAWAAYPPYASENTKLEEAFNHNFTLCKSTRFKKYGENLKTEKCNLSEKKLTDKAVQLPQDMLNSDTESACVDFSFTKACPDIFLFEKKKSGAQIKKIRLKAIEPKHGLLKDESFCCNLDRIQFSKKNENIFVRLDGHGRMCGSQGTTYSESSAFYFLKGNQLKYKGEVSIGYH